MKKLILLMLPVAICLSGCFSTPKQTDIPIQTQATVPTLDPDSLPVALQQDMVAVSLPVIEEVLSDSEGNTLFSYQAQTMSLVLPDPGVGENILQDFNKRQQTFRQAAQSTKALAEGYSSASPLFYKASFSPSRMDMNVLSLKGTIINWAGGMHPDISCISANYDMVTGDSLTLGSILVHADMADELGELVIAAIDAEKEKFQIWSGFEQSIRDRFAENISNDQAWYFSNTGLCFHFPPYELAPYSSGIVTVTVPYEALVGIMDEAYFPAEQVEANGQLQLVTLDDADLSQFDQIAEVIAEENGHMVLLYTDSAINQVTIELDHNHTIFATPELTPGDAIMLEADLADHILVVHYTSGGQAQSRYIQAAESVVRLLEDIPE